MSVLSNRLRGSASGMFHLEGLSIEILTGK